MVLSTTRCTYLVGSTLMARILGSPGNSIPQAPPTRKRPTGRDFSQINPVALLH